MKIIFFTWQINRTDITTESSITSKVLFMKLNKQLIIISRMDRNKEEIRFI